MTTQVVILCGGRGTRLGKLTQNCQKCLLPVGGRPFLDLVIEEYAKHDLRSFVLVAGHLHEQIETAYAEWGQWRGLDVQIVVEPESKGTLGALHTIRNSTIDLGQRILLANGDTLIQSDTRPQNFSGKALAFRIRQKDCGLRSIRIDVLMDAWRGIGNIIPEGQTIEEGLFLRYPPKWQNLDAENSHFIDIGTPENYERAKVIFR